LAQAVQDGEKRERNMININIVQKQQMCVNRVNTRGAAHRTSPKSKKRFVSEQCHPKVGEKRNCLHHGHNHTAHVQKTIFFTFEGLDHHDPGVVLPILCVTQRKEKRLNYPWRALIP
jgi:hypothetical protein